MKMTPEHFASLRAAVIVIDPSGVLRGRYRSLLGDSAFRPMRYRWDVLHASKFDTRPLYAYLNDDHIDTALRAIMEGAE